MTETANTYNSEFGAEMASNQSAYQVASATERQMRDRVIATWRDILHSYLKMLGNGDPRMVHAVIDDMDTFLNHAGGRRK